MVAGICGIASQLTGLATLLVAISSSPWFGWTEDNISVLGVEGSTAMMFNYGLVLTGVLSLVFAIGLGQSLLSNRPGKFGVVSLILGSLAISAMGVFPRTMDLPHDLASIAFFVFMTLALLLIGVALITRSRMRWGLLSLVAGMLMLVFQVVPWPWSGGATLQLLSCLPWLLWTVISGFGLLLKPSLFDV